MSSTARLGIGGPVGSGKSRLIERIVPLMAGRGYRIGIISNDVISKEDADRMRHTLAAEVPSQMVVGVATGGCPHTAVREDPSMNLAVIEEMEEAAELDLIIIESGGDNITTTFSPVLADYFIYVVDVAGGDKYPRKGGLGITNCDMLIINKTDLAPYVGADIDVMKRDARAIRGERPFLFTDCRAGKGIEPLVQRIIEDLLS